MNFHASNRTSESRQIAEEIRKERWFLVLWESGSKVNRRLAAMMVLDIIKKKSRNRRRRDKCSNEKMET